MNRGIREAQFTAALATDGDDLVVPIPEYHVKRLGLVAGLTVRVTLTPRMGQARNGGQLSEPCLTDYEMLLLQWLQEYHDGRDKIETVYVLLGLGKYQFEKARLGLQRLGLIERAGKEMLVTANGAQVWERQRGPRYRAEQARQKLQKLMKGKVNAIVCGGRRELRRKAIEWSTLEPRFRNRLLTPDAKRGVELELEALPKDEAGFVVVFHDAHRIPGPLLWAIRSVAQTQHHVVYIFEGANRGKMIDMVARYDAAFYQQLTVVDLSRQAFSRSPATRQRFTAHVRSVTVKPQAEDA